MPPISMGVGYRRGSRAASCVARARRVAGSVARLGVDGSVDGRSPAVAGARDAGRRSGRVVGSDPIGRRRGRGVDACGRHPVGGLRDERDLARLLDGRPGSETPSTCGSS